MVDRRSCLGARRNTSSRALSVWKPAADSCFIRTVGLKIATLSGSIKDIVRLRSRPRFSIRSVGSYTLRARNNFSYRNMPKSNGQCVNLITYRFSLTNNRNGMVYRKGLRNHAKMLLGATYEKRASFLTIEIVFTAKTN